MNIIKKARISVDKISIDAYGRSVEYAISSNVLDYFKYPKSIKIDYKGEEVICSIEKINPNSTIYLSDCTVGGRIVDYSYGKNILYK